MQRLRLRRRIGKHTNFCSRKSHSRRCTTKWLLARHPFSSYPSCFTGACHIHAGVCRSTGRDSSENVRICASCLQAKLGARGRNSTKLHSWAIFPFSNMRRCSSSEKVCHRQVARYRNMRTLQQHEMFAEMRMQYVLQTTMHALLETLMKSCGALCFGLIPELAEELEAMLKNLQNAVRRNRLGRSKCTRNASLVS